MVVCGRAVMYGVMVFVGDAWRWYGAGMLWCNDSGR